MIRPKLTKRKRDELTKLLSGALEHQFRLWKQVRDIEGTLGFDLRDVDAALGYVVSSMPKTESDLSRREHWQSVHTLKEFLALVGRDRNRRGILSAGRGYR